VKVGVIANSGKSLDGGLLELRRALERAGIANPLWHEVPKSRKAPKAMRRLLESKTELVFVWGGDGMLQRCIDVVAGSDVALAIVPAGTSNLLATNLGVPEDIEQAVEIGLEGERRRLDVAGGVVIGIASLCALVLACRAAGAAATGLAGERL